MSVFLRFADLKSRGVVGNWMTLKRWIDRENFPPVSSLARTQEPGMKRKLLNGSPVAQVGGLKNGETSHDRAPRNLFRFSGAICPSRRAEACRASHRQAS